MVKSKNIYSPQNFVMELTGYAYVFDGSNMCYRIHQLLKKHGIEDDYYNPLYDYPLDEIQHIVENEINVVLVDVSGFDKNDKWATEYRWFQVPEDFKDEEY
jgi:hypothetical protein